MLKYRLARGVTLQEGEGTGAVLTREHPLKILRLSGEGFKVIRGLCGEDQDFDLDRQQLISFASRLEKKGFLIRIFPGWQPEEALPQVTVVIPTYQRSQKLQSCLDSLLQLDYPGERLELIVVDDASPEPIDLSAYSAQVRVLRMETNSGPGAARNRAVSEARGEIIAFLDDDCLAKEDWLQQLVPSFQASDLGAVGGAVASADLKTPLGKYEASNSPLFMGKEQRRIREDGALTYLPTCNLLVRRSTLLRVGGFNPRLRVGEDVDLCWRILQQRESIYYLPRGLVYHHHRSKVTSFMQRRYHYGQSEAKLYREHQQDKARLPLFQGNGLIFLVGIITMLVFGIRSFLAVTGGLFFLNLFWQLFGKYLLLERKGYPLGPGKVLLVLLRAQASALYLYNQRLNRYYFLLITVPALLILPWLALLVFILHLLQGLVEYLLKRPGLNPLYFILFFLLDNVAYQAGVIRGCIRERNWLPLGIGFIPESEGNVL